MGLVWKRFLFHKSKVPWPEAQKPSFAELTGSCKLLFYAKSGCSGTKGEDRKKESKNCIRFATKRRFNKESPLNILVWVAGLEPASLRVGNFMKIPRYPLHISSNELSRASGICRTKYMYKIFIKIRYRNLLNPISQRLPINYTH